MDEDQAEEVSDNTKQQLKRKRQPTPLDNSNEEFEDHIRERAKEENLVNFIAANKVQKVRN